MSNDARSDLEAFVPDEFGTLRDIIVDDTDERDWESVLDLLRATATTLRYTVDGVPARLPETAAEIFAMREHARPTLHVSLNGIRLNLYPFAVGSIEFDVDPREIASPEQAAAVLAFMQSLANRLGKPVVLAEEGTSPTPLRRVEPALQATG